MEQPKTKVLLPTYKLNQLIKHTGIGTLSVQQIKDMGFSPIYEIQAEKGKGGYYWCPSVVSEIEKKINSKKIKSSNSIVNEIYEIKSIIEDLSKAVKETQENQHDLVSINKRDNAEMIRLLGLMLQLVKSTQGIK